MGIGKAIGNAKEALIAIQDTMVERLLYLLKHLVQLQHLRSTSISTVSDRMVY
jgi:hypothetical protein